MTVGDTVRSSAVKYREARKALMSLGGEEHCAGFKPLLDADLVLWEEVEADAEAMRHLGSLGRWEPKGVKASAKQLKGKKKDHVYVSQKGRMMSWIWTAMGGPQSEAECLNKCETRRHLLCHTDLSTAAIWIEWAKARARKCQWEKEVKCLKEEMRRTLQSLVKAEADWIS